MAAEQRSDRWRREQVGLRYRSKVWFHRAGPGMGDRPAQIDSASPPFVPFVPFVPCISRVLIAELDGIYGGEPQRALRSCPEGE